MNENTILNQSEIKLFNHIPYDLFKPLSSQGRQFYSDLLVWLYTEVFVYVAETPSKKDIIGHVQRFIDVQGKKGILSYEDGADLKFRHSERGEKSKDKLIVYRRLTQTGWLLEHSFRYTTVVDLDPDARMVLRNLVAISKGEAKSYGGAVLNVLNNLEAAQKDPDNKSQSVNSAMLFAQDFVQHLKSLGGAMRKVEQEILNKSNRLNVLKNLFENFIEKHLITDYKKLRTTNNPFRFRTRIIDICFEIETCPLTIQKLSESYVREQNADNVDEAEKLIISELYEIRTAFENLEHGLTLIEETTQRLEKRVRNIIKYMDHSRNESTNRIMETLENLSRVVINQEIPSNALTPHPFEFPVSSVSLYSTKARKKPPIKRNILIQKRDPAAEAFQKLKREYYRFTHPNKNQIDAFITNILRDKNEIKGSEISIESIQDFIMFERIRVLPQLFGGLFKSKYQFNRLEAELTNDWVKCKDFQIKRRAA